MSRTSIPLLLVAALTIHCDKSGSDSNTPEPPEPLPAGLGPHPEVDGELPTVDQMLRERYADTRWEQKKATTLWIGSGGTWERTRHQFSGAVIGRYFEGAYINKIVEEGEDDECYLNGFKIHQEYFENGQFGPSRWGTPYSYGTREITCSSADLPTYGYRPGGGGPGGGAADGATPEAEGAPAEGAAPEAAPPTAATPPTAASPPPASAGQPNSPYATADAYRQVFTQTFNMLDGGIKGMFPKIDAEEAEYKAWHDKLTAQSKQTTAYSDIVTQHDDIVKQAKAVKADYAAWIKYYESHKKAPTQEDTGRLGRDGQNLMPGISKVLTDYAQLKNKWMVIRP